MMESKEFSNILENPEKLSLAQIESLEQDIKVYPYCQALHALHLKGLKIKDSFKYNKALKVTAAYTADRSVLFDYITSEKFNQNKISSQIRQNTTSLKDIKVVDIDDISVDKSKSTAETLKAQIKATEGVFDADLFEIKAAPKQKIEEQNDQKPFIDIDVKNITAEEQLNLGKPLEFNKDENHSFLEWLKITSFKPIERTKEVKPHHNDPLKEKRASLENKLKLIDKFIKDNPKIKPSFEQPAKPRLINEEEDLSDHLMTETLAKIYLEQKKYDKAIQSYKILSLKYPEKSSFFAHQIKAVKELKEQNNTK